MKRVWKFKAGGFTRDESGYILIMSLFVLAVLFLLGTTLAIMGVQEFALSARTKVMDQAYSIADTGVNRAALAVQTKADPAFSTTTPLFNPLETNPDNNYQKKGTESFGGGQFTWWVYQSDTMPTNSSYKVIRSRGRITKGDKTAERTIETRVVIGAGGEGYDASFDYCIYNGFASAGTGQDTWPCKTDYSPITYWAGTFTIDGQTVSDGDGHLPKGAVYTRGNIKIPTELASNVTIKGNVVATKDIALSNAWNTGVAGAGFNVDGNVIAGIGAAGGNATYTGTVGGSVMKPTTITGYLAAAGDVTIGTTAEIDLGGTIVDFGYNGGTNRGGIIAGGNVSLSATANFLCQMKLGQIYCAKKLTASNVASGGISVYLGNVGRAASDWVGAELSTAALTGNATVTNLYSQGRVNVTGGTAIIHMGNIYAGTDAGGMGVYVRCGGAGFDLGNMQAKGKIDVSTEGIGGGVGTMWSGGDVAFNATAVYTSVGAISACGKIDFTSYVMVGGMNVGRISANKDVRIDVDSAVVCGVYVNGLKSGGNVYQRIRGIGLSYMVFHDFSDSGWNAGPGTPTDTWAGYNPGGDAICAKGNIECHSAAGWVTLEGDTYNLLALENCGDAEAGGSCSSAWWHYHHDFTGGVGALQSWTPGVDDPGMPSMLAYVGPTDALGVLQSKLSTTPPTVDRSVLLALAGLKNEVNILEPNWTYFQTQAERDDQFGQKNPDGTPKAPHLIKDSGLEKDGDYDGGINNGIYFKWDNTKPYSTNETIYVTDGSDLYFDINWADENANFQGTIVTKGNVYLGKSGVAWNVDRSQTLNVVSGKDIINKMSGFAFASSNTCDFHLWAKGNIDLSNAVLCVSGKNTFNGSFTAGNMVTYSSKNLWENTTFNWSRWALDSAGWAPPFKVLSWKEI
jgi:hypothetical protein